MTGLRWLTAPFRCIRTFVLFGRKVLRIAGHVFRAEQFKAARVDLLYASGLGKSLDLAGHAEQWARTLDDLAGELEVEPPAHVTVLVVASPRTIWFGAAAHRQLGDFGRAADFLERAWQCTTSGSTATGLTPGWSSVSSTTC